MYCDIIKKMMRTERKSLIQGLDKFLYSNFYPLSLFILALTFYVLKLEVTGEIVLASIMLFVLVVHRDTMPSLYPFLLICTLPLRMYNVQDVWLKLIPLLAVVVPAIVFHFVYYRPKFTLGKMFFPYLAIAIAVTVGGLFTISFKQYFNFTPLYYVVGLGFGMLLIYVLLNGHAGTAERKYDLTNYLTKTMLWFGGFLICMVAVYYIENFYEILNGEMDIYMQMKNNVSTSLLITMPFAFYYSKKCKYHTVMYMFGILQYVAMFVSFARSGILCGTIMVVICALYGLYINEKSDRKYMIACLCSLIVLGGMLVYINYDSLLYTLSIKNGEARIDLYKYAVQNFKDHPIFGTGLGHIGDFYHPREGGLYWYHSSPFQIIGSMGIVGILAYAYQFVARMKLVSVKKNLFSVCALLSLCGLQLMSFVNPGEFCPFPYAFVMVMIFVIVEKNAFCIEKQR